MTITLRSKLFLQKIWSRILRQNKESLDLNHEDIIVLLAKNLKPKVYVELGLYQCRLFNKMIPQVSGRLIGVDINDQAGNYMKRCDKTEFLHVDTNKCAEILKSRGVVIDMLFIDADHSERAVMADFNNFFPLVREDGLIFLHDGYPKNEKYTQPGYCGDGYKAIFELSKHTETYEMTTIPLHPGLTICRKRTKQIPW